MSTTDSPNDTSWQKKVTVFSMPSQGAAGERFYTERCRYHVMPLLEPAFLSTKQEDGKFLVASVEMRIWKDDRIRKEQIDDFLGLTKGLHSDLALLIKGQCRGTDGVVRDLVDEKGKPVSMPAYYLDFDRRDGFEERELRREVPLHLLHTFFKASMREPKVRPKHSQKFGRIDYFDQALRMTQGSSDEGTADVASTCIGWATGRLPRVPTIQGDKAMVRNVKSMGYLVFVPGKLIEMLLALYPRMEASYYRKMVSIQHEVTDKHQPTERGLLRARNERAPETEQAKTGDDAATEGGKPEDKHGAKRKSAPRAAFSDLPPEKQAEILAAQAAKIEQMKEGIANESDEGKKAKLQKELDGILARAAKGKAKAESKSKKDESPDAAPEPAAPN